MKIKIQTTTNDSAVNIHGSWFAQWSADEQGYMWRAEIKPQGEEPTEEEIAETIAREGRNDLISKTKRYTKSERSFGESVLSALSRCLSKDNITFADFLAEVRSTLGDRISSNAEDLQGIKNEINDKAFSNEEALTLTDFFPKWGEDIKAGTSLTAGYRFQYNGKLWEVRQSHSVNINQAPSITTAALYKEVVVEVQGEEQGTKDNPITYDGNLELFKDKYYTQGGKLYLCIRNSEQPMYHALSGLVGNYGELVNE